VCERFTFYDRLRIPGPGDKLVSRVGEKIKVPSRKFESENAGAIFECEPVFIQGLEIPRDRQTFIKRSNGPCAEIKIVALPR